jgi:hypothetical protein
MLVKGTDPDPDLSIIKQKFTSTDLYVMNDVNVPSKSTVIARISVTFSTLYSFISAKKMFDEHVYLIQNAHEP